MTAPPHAPDSLIEFQDRFSTEVACEEHLFAWRWPEGFRCPQCGSEKATRLRTRTVYQCGERACRHQASVTAGTVFHRSKVPLRKWFWAIFQFARHKKSISALQLQRDLGLGSHRTAWLMLQKLRSCLSEKPEWPLQGIVEIDETMVGARGKSSRPGKCQPKKEVVIGAVELGVKTKRGFHRWNALRLQVIPDFSKQSIGTFVHDQIKAGTVLHRDGLSAYDHLEQEGFPQVVDRSSTRSRPQMREDNPLPHVHLAFSNLKTWLAGCFHGVSRRYLQRYLDEFVYRTARRLRPAAIFDWVLRRGLGSEPMPLAALRSG